MYIDKVILMILLCAISTCRSNETRNARMITSSLFMWPQMLFRNRPSFSIIPKSWFNRAQLREWTKDNVDNLLRFVSFISGKGPVQIEFEPEDGPRAAPAYQRHYGYRGERLIEQLGNGFDSDTRQSVPSIFLTPPSPLFRNRNGLYL